MTLSLAKNVMKSLNSNSQERELHQLQQMQQKAKERCMTYFGSLQSLLQVLLNEDLKGTRTEHGFKRAFISLFGQNVETFTSTMFLYVDQLEKQLDKEEFQEDGSMAAFLVLNRQCQQFIYSQFSLDYANQMPNKSFSEYTQIEAKDFRDTLIKHMSSVKKSIAKRARHQRQYDRRVNETQMKMQEREVNRGKALDVDLVVPESKETESEMHDTSSRFGNDTHAEDANIKPVNDKEPMAENAEKCQVSCPLLDPSFDNMTTEFSNQSLKSENISLKKTIAQLQKDFSRIEAHCVNELKYQNQALKDMQHGQIVNETSNNAKINKEIEVLETINIELEHSVAKLLAENEKLHKENEHLKQTYKDLYDSLKKTRVQTKDHNDSQIAQINSKTVENVDLKAQIQEKVFANVALKNELRKLKENSMDTKFAKPSILGKPILQPPKNQSVVRQLNAFKSERPNFSKPRFTSQVDVNNFDQRVSALETKMSEFNQTSQYAEAVSSILGIVDQHLASKMKEAVDVAVRLQSNKLKEEAKAENQEFFNQVDSTIKAIIKEHMKAQVSKIMPQIEKYVTESLRAEVLVRSTNQPQTSYAVATSLSEFELKKILIDKMETNKSINRSDIQKNLYNVLFEAYNTDKDIITSYGDVVTLKRGRDDQDKDEDPSTGSDLGTKEESKSTQAEELEFKAVDLEIQQGQGNESRHIDDQLNNEAAPKHDWFQKPDKPPTPDRAWNKSKSIDNMTQYILVRPAFNPLKGTCKSFAELEYHFEECYKAVNDKLDWHNPEGREYLFDLSKPLPLIEDRGRQVVPADYFINNDLEYLKGGCSSSKYATSTTRTKDAKGPKRQRFYAYAYHWKSLHDVYSKRRIIAVTSVKIMRWYDYGYLEEIVVQRDDNVLYKFKEGDFPRLNMRDIKDMLLLLVQKKLSNLDVDDRYDLGVALRMFTRCIVILHRVEDLQLGVESY
ncbi:hypothetical protein Tco_0520837 [Tanacetum coccineum]